MTGQSINTSKIITVFDDEYPEIANTLYRIHGNQYQYCFKNLMDLGMKRTINPDSTETGKQYEEDWLHPLMHVAGPLVVVNLATGIYSFVVSNAAPNDYIQLSNTAPYPAAPIEYIQSLQLWDRIEMPDFDGNALASIIDIAGLYTNTVTITFQLSDPSVVLTIASYVAGTPIVLRGSAFAEGSDQPGGRVYKELQDTWESQIVKTGFGMTGSQLIRKKWYTEVSDDSTGKFLGYRVLGMNRMEHAHMRAMDDALLFEEKTLQPIVDTTTQHNEVIHTTEGKIPYIKRRGYELPYAVGTWGPANMDVTEKTIDGEQGPNNYMALMGINLDQEKDNNLVNYWRNTQISYVVEAAKQSIFGGDEGKFMAVGFSWMKKGQVTYGFQRLPQLSDPRASGAPGYGGAGLGIFVPIATMPDRKDPSNKIPYWGVGYAALDGYSREHEIVDIMGATNGTHMSSKDLNNYGIKTHMANLQCGGNAMILWEPN